MKTRTRVCLAEFLGTAILVIVGCGSATMLAEIGITGVALAFGAAVAIMCYTIGKISGCHINPAVSLAALIDGRIKPLDFCFYIVSQFAGAFAATGLLYCFFTGNGIEDFGVNTALGTYMLTIQHWQAFIIEVVLTFIFVWVVMAVSSQEKYAQVAGLVIGVALTAVHLVGISLTGTSVNPARSLAPAVFLGGYALEDLWVFITAPFIGGALAGLAAVMFKNNEKA